MSIFPFPNPNLSDIAMEEWRRDFRLPLLSLILGYGTVDIVIQNPMDLVGETGSYIAD